MPTLSRRRFNQGAHRLAISMSVVFGFLIAFFMFKGIDFGEHSKFLPLPFAFGILGFLLVYMTIRFVGWAAGFAIPKRRRRPRTTPS
ncbi:MAG: hypothetical protein EXQ94_07350 [Alphaproteobacteria bacterium]|nr:hypothetical protein [Alphaproteobacteria bacterium]